MDWLLVLGLKGDLVESATLCLKTWVMLMLVLMDWPWKRKKEGHVSISKNSRPKCKHTAFGGYEMSYSFLNYEAFSIDYKII